MKTRFIIGTSLAALLLTAAISPTAQASLGDHRTIFTISAPVELPGRVLAAGSYVFKTMGDEGNTVQIINRSSNQVVATLFTIREEAAKVPTQPMLTLAETKGNTPEAIHTWFYPGDSTGWEFVYPHAKRPGRVLAKVLYGEIPSR